MRYAIGIDLGGTNVAASVVADNGEIIAAAEEPTQVERGVDGVLANLVRAARRAVAEATEKVADLTVDGVGIGAPGICDFDHGIIRFAPNLKWYDVPLTALVAAELELPAYLENDANCAALGEQWCGSAKGAQHLVLITLGTGVGGGLIFDGRIYRGVGGYSGEIGHMPAQVDGPLCGCGKRGCLETLTSATALARMGREAVVSGAKTSLKGVEKLDAKAVIEAARAGDQVAQGLVSTLAENLGRALGGIVNLLNPEKIVVGGGVSRAGEFLLAPVRAELKKHALGGPAEQVEVVAAALGNDAGLIGAASLCWR